MMLTFLGGFVFFFFGDSGCHWSTIISSKVKHGTCVLSTAHVCVHVQELMLPQCYRDSSMTALLLRCLCVSQLESYSNINVSKTHRNMFKKSKMNSCQMWDCFVIHIYFIFSPSKKSCLWVQYIFNHVNILGALSESK